MSDSSSPRRRRDAAVLASHALIALAALSATLGRASGADRPLLRLPPLVAVEPVHGERPTRLPPPREVIVVQQAEEVAAERIDPPPITPLVEPLVAPESTLAVDPSPLAPRTVAFCEFCGECDTGTCCPECHARGRWGRFGQAIYRGLCCPDPCYQPRWRPLADAAFFTAAVRPQNQQRFRWDFAEDLTLPDRAEYFWETRTVAPQGVDYDELRHYVEVAHGDFGAWFEYSYRALDADGAHAAGFGDMTIGTKTLLFDTELVQLAFQFATHIPQGVGSEGLGTGHVSLEPGLVLGLNLSPDSFLQAEISEWIPIGGDADTAGALFRYNVAYNRVLTRLHPCVPLIGVVEANGWGFQDGGYNDPNLSPTFQNASGESYLHGSAGVRLFVCDRADFGVSYSTPLSSGGWADTLVRSELRFRY